MASKPEQRMTFLEWLAIMNSAKCELNGHEPEQTYWDDRVAVASSAACACRKYRWTPERVRR